jgi:hypothetical protein
VELARWQANARCPWRAIAYRPVIAFALGALPAERRAVPP